MWRSSVDLARTRQTRLLCDPEPTPAEAELRRLKGVMDSLLLQVMGEPGAPENDALLCGRVARAGERGWDALWGISRRIRRAWRKKSIVLWRTTDCDER